MLRSNVVGDQVTINGKQYGATRLDLELDPGRYEVTISKPGFKPWNRTVALEAGNEMTLVGELEAFTTVNFRDGTWVGGVKTGDGTYQDADGLRYEGHFVDGEFHGQGTAWYPDAAATRETGLPDNARAKANGAALTGPGTPANSGPTSSMAKAP